jgi:hypothetical protein
VISQERFNEKMDALDKTNPKHLERLQKEQAAMLTVEPMPADFMNVGDIVTMNIKIVPKWWQFWKKPHIERKQSIIRAVGTGSG